MQKIVDSDLCDPQAEPTLCHPTFPLIIPLTPNSRSYINRFISPDNIIPHPFHSQSWNRYSYTFNNPINLSDPSGNDPPGNCYDKGICNVDPDNPVIISAATPSPGPMPNPTPSPVTATSTPQPSSLSTLSSKPSSTAVAVAVPTPPGTPAPPTAPLSGADVATILDFASTISDLGGEKNLNVWTENPAVGPAVGPLLDANSQLQKDSGSNYTQVQEGVRVLTHVGEVYFTGQAATWAFGVVVVGGGGPEDPLADIAGAEVYVFVTVSLGDLSDTVNEKWWYPIVNKLP
jgi:hypothetical protein